MPAGRIFGLDPVAAPMDKLFRDHRLARFGLAPRGTTNGLPKEGRKVNFTRLLLAVALGVLAGVAGGCASDAGPEKPNKVRITYPPVPGEAFLRAPDCTLVALEVRVSVPLHLEPEVFLGGDKVRRFTEGDKKMKEARGHASMQFGEGLRIHHDTERILVTFDPACKKIRLKARGLVVLVDQNAGRVVRDATSLDVNGDVVVFHGPFTEEAIPQNRGNRGNRAQEK